jgi:hypothetical protein
MLAALEDHYCICMPSIEDMVDYDLTLMTLEIKEVLEIKEISAAQRRALDEIIERYAERQVDIVASYV